MTTKCYVSAPDYARHFKRARERRIMNGTIKSLHKDKGFGFIKGTDGKEYFMHRSALKNVNIEELEVGREVEFEDSESSKGLRAEDVYV